MLPVTTAKTPRPPRLFLYGPPGIGKTTLCAAFPGVLILPVEEGADALDAPRLPQPKSWEEAMTLLDEVAVEPSGYRCLCIDSVTALEALACRYVCEDQKVKSVEEIPYGKGFPLVANLWNTFLDRLEVIRSKGLAILLIGHQAVVSYADPRTAAYDRFQPRLHKSILPQTIERCDALLLANYKVYTDSEDKGFNKTRVRALGSGERVLMCDEQPTHLAKNRYALASELPFGWAHVLAGISAAFAPSIKVSAPVTTTQQVATSAA